MSEYSTITIARFWAKVDIRGPDDCWPWTEGTDKGGYGKFVTSNPSRRTVRTNVATFEIVKGERGGLHVCHSCDNPPCCNPAHLWLGTNQQNTADRVSKGRSFRPKGSLHGMSKLTEPQVREIKALLSAGVMGKDIAPRYNVCVMTISLIKTGRGWPHVSPDSPGPA